MLERPGFARLLWRGALCLICLAPALALGADVFGAVPIAVSPGEEGDGEAVEIDGHCPLFSWTAVPDSSGYELVVFALDEGSDAAPVRADEPVLRRRLPGGATAWMPPRALCLAPGVYAWAVRGEGMGAGDGWSAARSFRVGGGAAWSAAAAAPPSFEPPQLRSPAAGASSHDAPVLSADGLIASTSGGFRFPDASVQRKAFNLEVYYAAVQANGTKAKGNVSAVTRTNLGHYDLDLDRNAVGCVAVVTRGAHPGSGGATVHSANGTVRIPSPTGPTIIEVQTQDEDFDLVDTNFFFVAVCPPPLIIVGLQ